MGKNQEVKYMKKVLALILALSMLLSLGGCLANPITEENIDFVIDVIDQLDQALQEEDKQDAPAPGEDAPPQDSAEPSKDEMPGAEDVQSEEAALDEHGTYTTKEDVALYIHLYGHLPQNFITKDEARKLGWPGGSLEPYAEGKCIGGDRFGNYEGLLPEAKGRTYTECDIDTLGAKERGSKRIVFSNDGLIYYTPDHYETFELLYGEAGE